MDYEQETYDDYYDYIDTSDVLEQHPASYAPDGVLGPLAAENDDSSCTRQPLFNYLRY
jgi:hypothetical protein